MKVGTDGVLIGAWAPLPHSGRLLDIGTGTGMIALMAAQREPGLCITGIDIDAGATSQAQENVDSSPFQERITIAQADLRTYESPPFDAIMCNPPFFEEDLLPPNAARSLARHTHSLPFTALVGNASRLLLPGGLFSVILPTSATDTFLSTCLAHDMMLHAMMRVQTTARKPPKRTLLSFVRLPLQEDAAALPQPAMQAESLVLQEGASRSEAYQTLTRDFYKW